MAAADVFAMESATYHTAALVDSGAEDFILETAMLKVFASDSLWRIVNDTLQIYGGAGFFTDLPFERMMRDARLNLIGEGANDVLRCFIAMVGLRNVGRRLQELLKKPWKVLNLRRPAPKIPVIQRTSGQLGTHSRLQLSAQLLSEQIVRFSRACQRMLMRFRESIFDQQHIQARLADTATELFLSSCVYARLHTMTSQTDRLSKQSQRDLDTGLFYMRTARRRNDERLAALKSNDDVHVNHIANVWLTGE